MPKNRITILGCGTSTGVPRIFCRCPVCRSKNPKNHRLRASAWIEMNGIHLLIDTSTDLRLQAIRARIPRIDAILYTHPHADHLHGIDEIRSFNIIQNEVIPAYGNAWTCQELRTRFGYILDTEKQHPGGGAPRVALHEITPHSHPFQVKNLTIQAIPLRHGSQETLAYRIDHVAYVTDCSYVPKQSLDQLQDLSVLVLDCLQLEPHRTHLNLDQALEVVTHVKPRKTVLTHMGHDFDYSVWRKRLPKGVELAYDGMKLKLE